MRVALVTGRLELGVSEPRVRFQIRAFGPFVPRVDEDDAVCAAACSRVSAIAASSHARNAPWSRLRNMRLLFWRLPDHFRSDDFLLRHISYNTEQLPSPWFSSAIRYMLSARALIDINFQSAVALSSTLPTLHALPTMSRRSRDKYLLQTDFSHPLFRWMDPKILAFLADPMQLGDRPIDVFLTGYGTADRAAILARAAPVLANKYCFLAYSNSSPQTTKPCDDMARALYANNLAAATSSKIMLNFHRYRVGYFEWERMAQGFLGGAAVVATRCLKSPFFDPATHYFETNIRNIGNLISWLLDSKEGRLASERTSKAAADVMANEATPERIGNHIVSFLSSLEKSRHG